MWDVNAGEEKNSHSNNENNNVENIDNNDCKNFFFKNDLRLKRLKNYELSTAWTAVFEGWNIEDCRSFQPDIVELLR